MKSIVALVDLSDVTFKVLRRAHDLARTLGSRVMLLHVAPETRVVGTTGEAGGILTEPAPERLQADQAKLQELTEVLARAGVDVAAEQIRGTTIKKIAEETHRLGADLAIMGAHHHFFLHDWFSRDLNRDVLDRVRCPVLVVPSDDTSSGRFQSVVVLVDFSEVTPRLLEQARVFARAFGAEIIIQHVLPPPALTDLGSGERDGRRAELRWQKNHSLLAEWCEGLSRDGIKVSTEELSGPAAETILEEAQRLGADLIIMGSHHHSAVYNLLVGNVTHQVLKLADRPVLVVPDR